MTGREVSRPRPMSGCPCSMARSGIAWRMRSSKSVSPSPWVRYLLLTLRDNRVDVLGERRLQLVHFGHRGSIEAQGFRSRIENPFLLEYQGPAELLFRFCHVISPRLLSDRS